MNKKYTFSKSNTDMLGEKKSPKLIMLTKLFHNVVIYKGAKVNKWPTDRESYKEYQEQQKPGGDQGNKMYTVCVGGEKPFEFQVDQQTINAKMDYLQKTDSGRMFN